MLSPQIMASAALPTDRNAPCLAATATPPCSPGGAVSSMQPSPGSIMPAPRGPSLGVAAVTAAVLGGADGAIRRYDGGTSIGITVRVPADGDLVPSRIQPTEATGRAGHFQADLAEREALRTADAAQASLLAA